MTAKNPNAPHRVCEHCGDPVQSGGRPSRDGRYWCKKAECRKHKAAVRYNQETAGEMVGQMAPLVCSHCNDALPARRARWSDIPGKRWCNKVECRADRARFVKEGDTGNIGAYSELTKRVQFLHFALAGPRVTCGTCGVKDAIPGFTHPDSNRKVCTAPAVGKDFLQRDDYYAAFFSRLEKLPTSITGEEG